MTEQDWIEPPASVWYALPGGPVAEHNGEVWQYMGPATRAGVRYYSFRHRSHKAYAAERAYYWLPVDVAWAD